MSQQVQGRVFDSSLYAFIADVAVSLSSSGYATTSYVDGSLAERDSSIEFLAEYEVIQDASIDVLETAITNIDTSIVNLDLLTQKLDSSVNYLYLKDLNLDTSLNEIWIKEGYQDTSILNLDLKTQTLDSSIIALRTKDTNIDTSLNALWTKEGYQDSSITNLDLKNLSQDSSIIALRTKDTNIDISLNALWTKEWDQDTSITNLRNYTDGSLNAKIGLDSLYPYATNASVGAALEPFATNASVGLAIADFATNSSVNNALLPFATNASIGLALDYFIRSASTGSGLAWNSGVLDVSVATEGADITYVDGSLAERDVSIAWLNANKVNQTLFDSSISALTVINNNQDISINLINNWNIEQDVSIAWCAANISGFPEASVNEIYSYVDGSLNLKVNKTLFDSSISALTVVNDNQDASILILNNWNISQDASLDLKLSSADASTTYAKRLTDFTVKDVSYLATASDNNNIIFADTSAMYVIFPNSLPVGFQTTVINRTTGAITLNASTYYATDSSIVLRDRYAAASIVCSSTGVFYFMGNLK